MNLKQGKWLVAVSGGPDSMALLQMCLEEGVDCGCAHVNYHHRAQADEEETYVRAFCAARSIPCHVWNEPFVYSGNFEAAARERRYAFFAQVVKEYHYSGVLIAHHMDDAIETFLMQEEKGLIPDWYGLKEERMLEGILVARPLLSYTKQQLEDYCRKRSIRTFFDETNDDTALTRNRFRHEVLDQMSLFEKQMVMEEIKRKNAELQERRCRLKTEIREDAIALERYRAHREEERLTLLYEFLKGTVSYSRKGLQEIDHILCNRSDFLIPVGEKQLIQKEGQLYCVSPAVPYSFEIVHPEDLSAVSCPYFRIEAGRAGVNAVTVTETDYPLTIRTVTDGDQIRMRFGTKSVHRFFIDRHITRYERTCWPVVLNAAGEVILVPGLGCDINHYSISPTFSVIQYFSHE